MNARVVVSLVKSVVAAPVRKVAPNGLREAAILAGAKLLGMAHRTNPSGNNMSQR